MGRKKLHKDFVGAYVYEILVDGIVRYVGKGVEYRVLSHFARARELNFKRESGEKIKAYLVHNKLAKAIREGRNLEHRVLINNLSHEEAFAFEREQIAKYPKDQLWNIQPGGEGTDGAYMRELWKDQGFRDKLTASIAEGHRDPNYIEHARRVSQSKWDDPQYYAEKVTHQQKLREDSVWAVSHTEAQKKVWEGEEKRIEHGLMVKKIWEKSPGRKVEQASFMTDFWADPKNKAQTGAAISAAYTEKRKLDSKNRMTALWADPIWRASQIKRMADNKAKKGKSNGQS